MTPGYLLDPCSMLGLLCPFPSIWQRILLLQWTTFGVHSKHGARQFVTKLWVSDCKGNFHLATCLCDNASEEIFNPILSYPTTACLIPLIPLPWREFLDTLS